MYIDNYLKTNVPKVFGPIFNYFIEDVRNGKVEKTIKRMKKKHQVLFEAKTEEVLIDEAKFALKKIVGGDHLFIEFGSSLPIIDMVKEYFMLIPGNIFIGPYNVLRSDDPAYYTFGTKGKDPEHHQEMIRKDSERFEFTSKPVSEQSYFDFFEITAQPIIDGSMNGGFKKFLQLYIDFREYKPIAVQNFLNLCGNREIIPYNPEQWQINEKIGDMMFYEKWMKYDELWMKSDEKWRKYPTSKFSEKLLMRYIFTESKNVQEIKNSITFDEFLSLLNEINLYICDYPKKYNDVIYIDVIIHNPETKLFKKIRNEEEQAYEFCFKSITKQFQKNKKPAYNNKKRTKTSLY
jgi:hypothetical protein